MAQKRSAIDELKARRLLSTQANAVRRRAGLLREIATLDKCIAETDTTQISRKAAHLWAANAREKLQELMRQEMARLSISTLPVAHHFSTRVGQPEYGFRLQSTARGATLPQVISEGEYRALALASFFADLRMHPPAGGVIFDDPVCSFDDIRRMSAASRIVELAADRQVIVFTHDAVFFGNIKEEAERQRRPFDARHIARGPSGPGVCNGGASMGGRRGR